MSYVYYADRNVPTRYLSFSVQVKYNWLPQKRNLLSDGWEQGHQYNKRPIVLSYEWDKASKILHKNW